jgi:hypothetical protein
MKSIVLLIVLVPSLALAGQQKPCVTADEATKLVNKDVCVSAHIYDVVELPDGTRFLDVCTPDTPDEKCRFTIVSLWEDREEVGELRKYRDMNVQVRGIVRPMHGRAGMVLSHARQFYGGPPVIFQEVVHSIETGEAVCDEQAEPSEESNGLSQECPMDGDQSRAAGALGGGGWRDRGSGCGPVRRQLEDSWEMDWAVSSVRGRWPDRPEFAAAS